MSERREAGIATFRRSVPALVVVLGAAVLGACDPPPPPPPPPPPSPPPTACATSTAPEPAAPPTAVPPVDPDGPALSEDAAAWQAVVAVTTNPQRDEQGDIPLVTVTRDGVETVRVDDVEEAAAEAAETAADGDVLAVEVDTVATVAVASDPKRPQQWALNETTFEAAWPTTTGVGVRVAVVDTGVQTSHPDLKGHIVKGQEFLNGNGTGAPNCKNDPHDHGTHVAGIIAATANNGIGVAGGAPGVKIQPVRVLDEWGTGWNSDIAAGVRWAADHGSKVINLSLGGSGYSAALANAISYAKSKGAVVVAAAGNSGTGGWWSYPAANTGAGEPIAVASVTSSLAKSSFSTTASYVDVAAPGSSVLSTIPPSGYAFFSGTSMATPYVVAAAALVKAAYPGCAPDAVRQALLATADDLGAAGPDTWYGHGLVDPAEAVASAAATC